MLIDKDIDWHNNQWLWYGDVDAENQFVEFRCTWSASSTTNKAFIALACRGFFRLFVNEQEIHNGPCREVEPFVAYDVIDLQSLLTIGEQQIRIVVHHAGINHQSATATDAGLLIQGHIHYDDQVIQLSDPLHWRARNEQSYRPAWRLGGCLGFAEHRDFHAAVDDFSDVRCYDVAANTIFLPRTSPAFPSIKQTPVQMQTLQDGILIDFGQEVFGFVELQLHDDEACDIDLSYAEHLSHGAVDHRKAGMDYRDRLSVTEGTTHYRSLSPRACRYLFINNPHVHVHYICIDEQLYPFQAHYRNAKCATEDRRFIEISARSIQLCSEDLQVDCPWRERAQYLDPYATITAMQVLFHDVTPIKRWLLQLARGCQDRGHLPMCYPSAASRGVIPDFQAVYALAVHRFYEITQDLDTVRTCIGAAETAINDLRTACNQDGLLDQVPGWLFIDNSFHLSRRPCSSALNAIYAGALRSLADLHQALNQNQQAEDYQQQYQDVRKAFRQAFVTENTLRDSLLDYGPWQWWNHQAIGSELCDQNERCRITLNGRVHIHTNVSQLAVAHYENLCRVFVNDQLLYHADEHGGWTNPPLDTPQIIPASLQENDIITIEYDYSAIDWEIYIATDGDITWHDVTASKNNTTYPAELRPYERPLMSQVSVGLAAEHGLLEDQEAQVFLRNCLRSEYYESWQRRTTPLFVTSCADRYKLKQNILPGNTPWAMYPFCRALRRYGMQEEAKQFIRFVYQHMIDQNASTWWEEFNTGSSLCHAWGAWIAEFLID